MAKRPPPEIDYQELYPGLIRVDDRDVDFNKNNVVVENSKSHIFYHLDRYVVSTSRRDAGKEIEFMKKAGDLAIQPVGYLVSNEWLDGYMMPLASAFKPMTLSIAEKKIYMAQMVNVIENLHRAKNIIHGDVKLSNFLLCGDGKVRLCDFEESQIIGKETPPRFATEKYRPPWRVRAVFSKTDRPDDSSEVPPLSVEDDYYGLGLSIWELFTERQIFEDLLGLEAERDYIVHGVVPDVKEAEDDDAIEAIWKYLERGARGEVDRKKSPIYLVTGPPIDTLSYMQLMLPHSLRR